MENKYNDELERYEKSNLEILKNLLVLDVELSSMIVEIQASFFIPLLEIHFSCSCFSSSWGSEGSISSVRCFVSSPLISGIGNLSDKKLS